MALEQELGYILPLEQPHAAVLNLYYTTSCLKKFATEFFQKFGLTDVQFNLMMLLKYQTDDATPGLSQTKLSEMMLVNRANITSLIDRMEKAGLVKRTAVPDDRRTYMVVLTPKSIQLLEQVEPLYEKTVLDVVAPLKDAEQKQLIKLMEKIRQRISSMQLE